MPLPELPRMMEPVALLRDTASPPPPLPPPAAVSVAPAPPPAAPAPVPVSEVPVVVAAAPVSPALDVNTIVFLQQQLERVVTFMRTVDARLDSLERTTLQLLSQQERLNKQLELRQQRAPSSSLSASGNGGGGGNGGAEAGGVCPLCGAFFIDSNELQMHAQTCLDRRELRDRRSSNSGAPTAPQKDAGILGRLLGKH